MTRLEVLEQRLAALETEVAELRIQVRGPSTAEPVRREGPAFPPPLAPRRPAAAPPPRPTPPPAAVTQPRPAPAPVKPPRPRREIDYSALFGAFGLAVAGGIVTVLGIVFFFVLAANRGWIGPELRLAFGAAASVGVFAAGFWLRGRFGTTYAALAAVGAGIAGAYATLLAATALYGFVPELGALAAAAGIAAVATVVALRWQEELVAALGLIGALLVPLMTLVEDGELTLIGTAFAALVFTAVAVVALRERWTALLIAGLVASFPQVVGLVLQSEPTDWAVVWLTVLFWALYVAVATVVQLTSKAKPLDPLAVWRPARVRGRSRPARRRTSSTADVADWSREGPRAPRRLGGLPRARRRRSSGAPATSRPFFWAVGSDGRRGRRRGASGRRLARGRLGGRGHRPRVGRRGVTRERRFRLASLGYLLLALAYTLGHEAPFDDLFEASPHPAIGVPSVLAVAAASLARRLVLAARTGRVGRRGRARAPPRPRRVPLARGRAARLRRFARDPRAGGRASSFEVGQVALTGFWALLAFALVEAGGRVRRLDLELAGLVFLGCTALKTVGYDHDRLDPELWAIAFLLVAAFALLSGFEYQRLGGERRPGLQAESTARRRRERHHGRLRARRARRWNLERASTGSAACSSCSPSPTPFSPRRSSGRPASAISPRSSGGSRWRSSPPRCSSCSPAPGSS